MKRTFFGKNGDNNTFSLQKNPFSTYEDQIKKLTDKLNTVSKDLSALPTRVSKHENDVKATIEIFGGIINELSAKVSVLTEKQITKEIIDKQREEIEKHFKEVIAKVRGEIRKVKVQRGVDTVPVAAKTDNIPERLHDIDSSNQQNDQEASTQA